MKTILILLSTILMNSCNASKDAKNSYTNSKSDSLRTEIPRSQNITKIEYVAISRGFYQRVTATPETITKQMARGEKEMTSNISKEAWVSLTNELTEIDMTSLTKLEAPSKKHQYDGAPGAYFQVLVGEELYRTPTFDGGNPPKLIKTVVNKLMEIAKNMKK